MYCARGLLLEVSRRPQGSSTKQLSHRWVEGFIYDSRGHESHLDSALLQNLPSVMVALSK
jgi:hypothetical protein